MAMATKTSICIDWVEEQFYREPFKFRRLNSFVAPWWQHNFVMAKDAVVEILAQQAEADTNAMLAHAMLHGAADMDM